MSHEFRNVNRRTRVAISERRGEAARATTDSRGASASQGGRPKRIACRSTAAIFVTLQLYHVFSRGNKAIVC